ncbi:MAG: glycosyltransferase family 9 protein [Deltaproteobacteria bacterium]|nr:glycosyltransferase family 9 protein [Deltaproteobacteria bacterium]
MAARAHRRRGDAAGLRDARGAQGRALLRARQETGRAAARPAQGARRALLRALDERPAASPAATPRPELVASPGDAERVAAKLRLLAAGKGYVVVSPFSVWGTKMWFADRFARTGAELARRHGLAVVGVGGGAGREAVIGRTIVEKVAEAGGKAVSLVGETSIGELKAVIKGARLVLANDSAPVHVAAAFNVPTVAIFGPTARKWGFFPLSERAIVVERLGLECRPCHIHGPQKCPKGHFRCMNDIQVEDVVQAVENLLR